MRNVFAVAVAVAVAGVKDNITSYFWVAHICIYDTVHEHTQFVDVRCAWHLHQLENNFWDESSPYLANYDIHLIRKSCLVH